MSEPIPKELLGAWQAPPASDLADAVIARLRDNGPARVVPVEPLAERRRRWQWFVVGVAVAAAAVVVALWAHHDRSVDLVERDAQPDRGTVAADRPMRSRLSGPTVVTVEAQARIDWLRSGNHVVASQRAGTATWTTSDDDRLAIDAGTLAAIEARRATLRVDVDMSHERVAVVVFEGAVEVSSPSGRLTAAAGSTIEVIRGQPPRHTVRRCDADQLEETGRDALERSDFGAASRSFMAALECRPKDQRLIRMAFLTACKATDHGLAQKLWRDLSPPSRNLKAVCISKGMPADWFPEDHAVDRHAADTQCDYDHLRAVAAAHYSSGNFAAAFVGYRAVLKCKPGDSYATKLAFATACKSNNAQAARQLWPGARAAGGVTLKALCLATGMEPNWFPP